MSKQSSIIRSLRLGEDWIGKADFNTSLGFNPLIHDREYEIKHFKMIKKLRRSKNKRNVSLLDN